jgi:hypothetical protein
MRIRRLHLFARVGLLALIWASLSGCILHAALGNINYFGDLGDGLKDYFHNLESNATGGSCYGFATPPHSEFIDCAYVIDGVPVSSTVSLLSELGVYGAFIDPLILEVPDDVISVTATYDNGGGPQPLAINRSGTFQVHPGLVVTAEVGTTFLFLDLPANADHDADLNYSLSYHRVLPPGPVQPAKIKAMLAGLVVAQHQTYYIPLLPCVTDFAQVPEITLPQSDTPQDLEMTLGNFIRNHEAGGCNNVTHDFSAALPPAGLVFVPVAQR